MTLHHHHPPLETQCEQYLSCYWPNFAQTLNIGFWDQQEQENHHHHQQQQHLSYYWPDFDQATFLDQQQQQHQQKQQQQQQKCLIYYWHDFDQTFLGLTTATTRSTVTTTKIKTTATTTWKTTNKTLILRRSLRKTNLWPLVSLLNHCLHNSYESPPALGSWLILWS